MAARLPHARAGVDQKRVGEFPNFSRSAYPLPVDGRREGRFENAPPWKEDGLEMHA